MGLPQEFLNRSLVIKYLHQFSKTEICGVELENVDKIMKILWVLIFVKIRIRLDLHLFIQDTGGSYCNFRQGALWLHFLW